MWTDDLWRPRHTTLGDGKKASRMTDILCYGDHAEGYARNDAVLAWDPVPGATGYDVYCDSSLLDSVDSDADCLVVAEPLGHAYAVAAVNEVGSSSSTEAQLVSKIWGRYPYIP